MDHHEFQLEWDLKSWKEQLQLGIEAAVSEMLRIVEVLVVVVIFSVGLKPTGNLRLTS